MNEELAELRRSGVVRLTGFVSPQSIAPLASAAERLYQAAPSLPEHYRYSIYSHSAVVSALLDFGCSLDELSTPFNTFHHSSELLGGPASCRLDQSWVRRRYAPLHAPPYYQPNSWHQDGALGVRFGERNEPSPMNDLLTLWLPLQDCGEDCPRLEFLRQPLGSLLHFTELGNEEIRRRFPDGEFWAPTLQSGDALLFLNGTLHRTFVEPDMVRDRTSVEYRFFPVL